MVSVLLPDILHTARSSPVQVPEVPWRGSRMPIWPLHQALRHSGGERRRECRANGEESCLADCLKFSRLEPRSTFLNPCSGISGLMERYKFSLRFAVDHNSSRPQRPHPSVQRKNLVGSIDTGRRTKRSKRRSIIMLQSDNVGGALWISRRGEHCSDRIPGATSRSRRLTPLPVGCVPSMHAGLRQLR